MLDYNQKSFKRILKEIGLWNTWRKERMKYISRYNITNEQFIPSCIYFSNSIRTSFYFAKTENPILWNSICFPLFSNNRVIKEVWQLKQLKTEVRNNTHNKQ